MPTSNRLRALYRDFGQAEIDWLAEKEAVTRHDVKAVEYLVRDRLSTLGLDAIAELTHFACTSEDINSASYALTVQRAVERVWLPKLHAVIDALRELAEQHRDAAMLSRTHGQPATPTTMGKELAVFAWRLERVAAQIGGVRVPRASSPARPAPGRRTSPPTPTSTGRELSRAFIEGLGLGFNPLTTQIESHDWQVELYDRVRHAGGILHNLATDVWTYISIGYFSQIPVAGATGSSTMPHKINPIRFENAEANLEISGGLLSHAGVDARHLAACSATSPTRRRSATSASPSGTRCSPSTTCSAGSERSRWPRTCCSPTSTRTGRCWPRRSRPSCAPRSPPAARRSPTRTRC